MELSVYNIKGEDTGKKVVLKDEIFGIEPNDHAIYLDVKQYLANRRQQKIYTDRLRETVLARTELDESGQPKAAQNIFGVQIKSGEEVALMQEILDLQNVEIDIKPVFTMDELSSLMATPEQFQAALPFIIEEE